MLFKPLALATVANSFVIIPFMTPIQSGESEFKALPVDNLVSHPLANVIPESAFSQSLSVPCENCVDRNTEIMMHFEIKDETKLHLNQFEVYPYTDPTRSNLEAVVQSQGVSSTVNLGYAIVASRKKTAEENKHKLVEVDIQILQIGNSTVSGIPVVKVNLIEVADGRLLMAPASLGKPTGSECFGFLCFATKLAESLRMHSHKLKTCIKKKIMGCLRKKPAQAPALKPAEPDTAGWDVISKGDIEAVESDKWRHLLVNAMRHVFMPIILGITAGVSVTLLALLIQAVARRFVRLARGKKDDERREEATFDEKAHLMP